MPGGNNFDNVIREVLNSTQPIGDVVQFPDLPKIMQDSAPIAPDDRMRRYPKVGPRYDNDYWYRQYYFPSPANDASIASAILRS